VSPLVNFVFTGQGAQWPGMGKGLMEEFTSFAEDMHELDVVLAKLPHPPVWTITGELSWESTRNLTEEERAKRFQQAEFSQPLCTAVQLGLINLLRRWNITPSAVVGHSSGEIAAGYAAGALTIAEAITVAYYRGFVTKEQTMLGGMAAVGLGKEDVVPHLTAGVVIACENSPSSVTVSGDVDAVDSLLVRLKEANAQTFCRRLQVTKAYHSRISHPFRYCYSPCHTDF
jgi:acyl transferase domain-containing protein